MLGIAVLRRDRITTKRRRAAVAVAAVVFLGLLLPARSQAQGIFVPSAGPINQSMGKAGVAAPLDAMGSLYLNPASITALESSELGFGLGLLLPVLETSSSIPGLTSGTLDAEPGATPLPNVGWVHKPKDSPFTYGLGVFAAAGFSTNFGASGSNPIFTPQSNTPGAPGGLGRVYTKASFLQLSPTVAVQLTDRLSIGVSPTITIGELIADPLVFAAPDDADGSGQPRYGSGRGTRTAWGGGAQLGAFYDSGADWRFGASIKSPQWMEDFRFKTENELGLPRVGTASVELPMVVSLGTSYTGLRDLVIALDVSYQDYANAEGFGDRGFNADGSVKGLGWDSIFVVAAGAQYRLHEKMTVRCGYTFNENPIPDSQAFLATAAPLYYQHQGHLGASYLVSENVSVNAAYSHAFEAELSGPLTTPAGAIPGTSVTNRESAHALSLGVAVKY